MTENATNLMIITIGGFPGSGKTTVAKMLADRLGYKQYSMGDLRGELAQKHGMTIDELNEVGKKEDWPHRKVDEYLEELGKTEDNIVVDTWIGFHLIPDSVKIMLKVDIYVAAKRIFANMVDRPDEKYASESKVVDTLKKRVAATDEGFQRLYGVSFQDESHYDFKLDTTDMTPEEVLEAVLNFLKK